MPNPKRRHSRSRTGKRRSHHHAKPKSVYVEKDSGSAHQSHNIDPKTGMYRGRQVITIKQKEKKPSK